MPTRSRRSSSTPTRTNSPPTSKQPAESPTRGDDNSVWNARRRRTTDHPGTPDALLGYARYARTDRNPVDVYVRQLWDCKASAEVATMTPEVLQRYAETCGAALARAHARSGDAAMIAGYLGDDDTFDRAVGTFAEAYADRTEQDHAELTADVDAGLIDVVRDI